MIRPHRGRRGMTLIEMLVATTITLIMMGLVAQLFGVFGQGISGGRSVIELTDQMRSASWRLRQDLSGITAVPVPPLRPESEQGYLEIIEGPMNDISDGMASLNGDCDDILMFTTRSPADPFVGRFENGTLESPTAEVAWFCKPSTQQIAGGPTLYTLYRRQLLVTAYVGAGSFRVNGNALPSTVAGPWQTFYANYDLSCRLDQSASALLPNSLGDLTKRENRFLHNPTGMVDAELFPYPPQQPAARFIDPTVPPPIGTPPPNYLETLIGHREGEDVVLSNVIAFDVRVFDPGAPIQVIADTAVTPGDPGFVGAGGVAISQGCYVDLNWGIPPGATSFDGPGAFVTASKDMAYPTYDTWSTSYEADGVDQDDDGMLDQGTNGFDNDDDGLIDEPDEAETSAPYPVPLRGLEVRIRCYEPSSRQVRQVTVRHTFVPH